MAKEMELLFKLLVVFCWFGFFSAQFSPVVEVGLGKIRGSVLKTEKGSDFLAFRGIRYAEAPVGEKRFAAPIAVSKWVGELDATKDGSMCPQMGKPLDMCAEDCLFLNVFTKSLIGNKSVLFYIHGGANIHGGSHSVEEAGPEYLIESDIVLVTMNFRLGPFGFLSTKTKEAPGNFGYLDQLMALQWVHDHISKFGGNPGSVTMIGMSAGAMAITLHMTSPLSRGLFHKVIVMSGSATSEQIIDNLYWTRKLAHDISCPMFNPRDVLDCLRKLPWQTIVSVSESWQAYNFIDMKWNYEIDGNFLTQSPTLAFVEGNFSKVPILTGITKDELTFMVYSHQNNTGFLNDVSLNFERYAQEFFMHNFEGQNVKKANEIKTFYLGNDTINGQNLRNFGEIFSDSLINYGAHRLIELARKHVDVYCYRFDYSGNVESVNHGDDLQYIIKKRKTQISPNEPEWFMVERMVGVLTSFAQNGSTSSIDGVKWLPSNKNQVNTMYIDREVKLGKEPYTERLKLWDSLYPSVKSGSSSICAGSLLTLFVVSTILLTKFIIS